MKKSMSLLATLILVLSLMIPAGMLAEKTNDSQMVSDGEQSGVIEAGDGDDGIEALTAEAWKAAPTGVKVKLKDVTVTMSWNHKGDSSTVYGIYEVSGKKETLVATTKKKKCSFTALNSGTNKYAVYPMKKDGKNWDKGKKSAVKTVKVKDHTVGGVVYTIKNQTWTVKKYKGSEKTLTIPGKVLKVAVTEIGASAFEGNQTLEAIKLPDSITVIGAKAFKNCKNLKNMK